MSCLWSVSFGIYWFASRGNKKQVLVFFLIKEELLKNKNHFLSIK